jgi:uncharacterized protein (TIGR03066 family)
MRMLLGCALAILAVHFSLSADDKKTDAIYAKKLVGKWAMKKDAGKTVVEFTKDGKMLVDTVVNEKPMKIEGTYKLEGKKLTVTVKAGGKEVERVQTIFDVTDTELITTDEQGKKEFSTRVKNK